MSVHMSNIGPYSKENPRHCVKCGLPVIEWSLPCTGQIPLEPHDVRAIIHTALEEYEPMTNSLISTNGSRPDELLIQFGEQSFRVLVQKI